MTDDAGSEARAVLRGSMAEMNTWEIRHYPLVVGGGSERFEDARRDLGPIYDRYVTPRERKMVHNARWRVPQMTRVPIR